MTTPTLSLLVLRATDSDATSRFYRALGCVFVQEQHASGPLHNSCELGNSVLEIYPAKSDAPMQTRAASATMIGFTVDSVDEVLEVLRGIGIEPKSPPKISDWGRWTNVTDPDGRTVQLTEAAS